MCPRNNRSLPLHLRQYVDSLVQRLRPQGIILFGSFATGEAHKRSDYDLFVVAEDLPHDFWERTDILWRNKPLDVEVLGFRPEEIENTIHRGLVLDALLTGKVLYGDISRFKKKAEQFVAEKKLTRTPAGYFRKASSG